MILPDQNSPIKKRGMVKIRKATECQAYINIYYIIAKY